MPFFRRRSTAPTRGRRPARSRLDPTQLPHTRHGLSPHSVPPLFNPSCFSPCTRPSRSREIPIRGFLSPIDSSLSPMTSRAVTAFLRCLFRTREPPTRPACTLRYPSTPSLLFTSSTTPSVQSDNVAAARCSGNATAQDARVGRSPMPNRRKALLTQVARLFPPSAARLPCDA